MLMWSHGGHDANFEIGKSGDHDMNQESQITGASGYQEPKDRLQQADSAQWVLVYLFSDLDDLEALQHSFKDNLVIAILPGEFLMV